MVRVFPCHCPVKGKKTKVKTFKIATTEGRGHGPVGEGAYRTPLVAQVSLAKYESDRRFAPGDIIYLDGLGAGPWRIDDWGRWDSIGNFGLLNHLDLFQGRGGPSLGVGNASPPGGTYVVKLTES
jgi:hypothetical protein